MRKLFQLSIFLGIIIVTTNYAKAQQVVHPEVILKPVYFDVSVPLKDMPTIGTDLYVDKATFIRNRDFKEKFYPFAEKSEAEVKNGDPLWQKFMGSSKGAGTIQQNFAGQSTTSYPPDCNGDVGPNHYFQTVNTTYAIYNKTGTKLAGPTNVNTLFSGVTGSSDNDGDPIILYDEQADRWMASEFALGVSGNDYMLIAVSTTADPTGTWFRWSFDVDDMPDYMKFGIWRDGYYMATNNGGNKDVYVFDRTTMLAGGASPTMVGFVNPNRPNVDFHCIMPLDNDGDFATVGTNGGFITINDNANEGSDELRIYELHADWVTPANSTFAMTQQLPVAAFVSEFTTTWDDITQPNSQKLDGIPDVLMYRAQYRNFGTYQSIVINHTVDVDNTNHAGIRWYELRKTTGNWSIRQSGTYAPDAHSRWLGSIAMNGSGEIGLGYSVSSSTVYPSIRFTGQSASENAAASGILDIPEFSGLAGTIAQSSYNRWGDYALMSVDPTDDQTFWFTTEYLITSSDKGSKVISFKLSNSPSIVTTAASNIVGSNATLNGTVNPNGFSTDYHFEWGATTAYGTSTATVNAGSGTSPVAVTANISGLIAGTTYHFRLVGENSEGTSNGNDMSFTPGAASLSTTTPSSVTMTSASSGGNITSDGGNTVTARGVCWSTTLNPVATGNHTTDGTGTGTFTSSITGLSSSTTYHVRAYATTSAGTFYGDDKTFTTQCGIISTFPWNEGFENAGTRPGCWTEANVTGTLPWAFQAGGQSSHPAAAHSGSYNAFLYQASYTASVTKLITPTLNLSTLSSATLKFWHTQTVWDTDQDELRVYYKTSSSGTWTLLQSYTTSITAWTQRTITLPALSSDYYIAFEGTAQYGYGVCVDDIQVSGTPIVGIQTISSNEAVHIMPNPNNGQFNLKFDRMIPSIDITISDITGKVVYQKNAKNTATMQIDLSEKSSGIYFIRMMFEDKVQTQKLIIK